ncbi:MAG: T9SS type B sorting domain-containing protein [Ferruginibacter sp.]
MPGLIFIRKYLLFVAPLFVFTNTLQAQSFSGTGGAIPGTSATTQTCFPLTVSGVGVINNSLGLSQVCINITHPYDDELEVILSAPDGTVVPLTVQNGGSGNNYTGTCFTGTAATSIKFASPPFTGTFLPEGHLGAVNNGQNANGTWRICVQDRRNSGNAGTLNSWSLTFSNTPAPQPPVLPSCSTTLPSSSSCSSATSVCDFNGLCGSTSGSSVQDWAGSGLDGCFGLQNNSFIKFIAATSTASFSVWVPNSTYSYNNGGIQMLFFSGTCNSGPVTTYGCYPHIFPYSGVSTPIITAVTAAGLTPGNTYYLMIDGYNSDNCNFTIAANSGVNILNVTPGGPSICNGQNVDLTATGGNGIYSWSPAGGLSATSGSVVTANPGTTTTYTVTSSTAFSCPITKDVTVNVNALPMAPTASVSVQPTCSTPTGTITISAPTGTNLEYSLDGITYQAGTSFTGLAPASYNVTVRNTITNCISATTPLTVNAVPGGPAAPTGSVTTQPSCYTPTGTITVTAPIGVNYEYSINGSNYQSATVFSGLISSGYNVTVRDINTGCVSAQTLLTVNTVPASPVAPTAAVTVQPTCTVPTGTITIIAPTGANYEYSVDGSTYQSNVIFTGVAPSGYSVTVRNVATGCGSAPRALTVNPVPGAPATPTASVTAQPTCIITKGTITLTGPTGINLEYSVNGTTYQNGMIFSNLSPANYNVTTRNSSTGCVSVPLLLTVDPVPPLPATPTTSVTAQPTCITNTGTILITAPTGANLEYSMNGSTYQPGTIFSGLTSANYNVTVRNTSNGCVSLTTPLTVNAIPVPPANPTATVTVQPNCNIPLGTIVITAPAGANLEYSIDGTNYQTGATFSGLATATYNVTVRNTVTECISGSNALTVNAITPPPALPTASVTTQPTCTIPTGTINIAAPTGGNYEYSINGITYQAGVSFAGLPPGGYPVTVKDIITGCISAATGLTVNPVPALPATPTASVTTQPNCITPTGTILITASTGANLQYSINGTTYQAGANFNGLSPANYFVTAKNTVTGCISQPIALVVNVVPAAPAAPTASVTVQPNCTVAKGTIIITAPTGANLEYSLNGSTYQPGTSFTNLAPNSYNATVRNSGTGCVSAATALTVNSAPVVPVAPTASVTTQPICTVPTGTITITVPNGSSLEYSVNGTVYQAGKIFSGLAPATYNVTVRNSSSGCVSTATILTVNAVPGAPAAPTAAVTVQPTCLVQTGTITITSPVGNNWAYSIDGNQYIQNVLFKILAPGSYNVTVKNLALGCISSPTVLTVFPVPAAPLLNATAIQPDCTNPKASITVTPPLNPDLRYSIDGINYQTGNAFSNLNVATNNSYFLTAKNIITGCISAPRVFPFVSNPGKPATPVVSLIHPTCASPIGSAVVITPRGSNIEYTIDGVNYQSSPIFPDLISANYQVVSKYVNVPCPSLPATFTIDVLNLQLCGDVFFPKAFSPNGDGINDKFGPLGNVALLNNYTLSVFNRLGELVFKTSDPAKKWDGMYKGKMLANSNYVWQATYSYQGFKKIQKGNLSLLR